MQQNNNPTKSPILRESNTAETVDKFLTSPAMVKAMSLALPRHMTPERMSRIALTEIRRNPMLGQADLASLGGAIMQAVSLGLEIGSSLGHAYLVPFRNRARGIIEVQLITGYKGFIELAMRSEKVTRIWTDAVMLGDLFDYESGSRPNLRHKPIGPRVDKDLTYSYACAKLAGDDTPIFEVVDRAHLDFIASNARGEVWKDNFIQMSRKTAVRRISHYLPQSPELRRAIELEDATEHGVGQELWRLYDGYEPPVVERDPTKVLSEGVADAKERAAEAELKTALGALSAIYTLAISVGIAPPMTLDNAKQLPVNEMQALTIKLQGDINARAKK